MSVVLYLILAVFGLSYLWIKRRCSYWTRLGFPSADVNFPFGLLKDVGTKTTFAEAEDVVYKKFKGQAPAVGEFFFLGPSLLAMDPEFCKSILVKDFTSFHDRGFYHNTKDQPIWTKYLIF